jgi:hypothetical protein
MGKENGTEEAFEIAKDFTEKRLSLFLKTHDIDNIENIFPLSHVPPARAAIREKLWESIEKKTPSRSRTVRDCRATLLFFSEWIFKEAVATGKHIPYEDPDAKYLPFSRHPAGGALGDAGVSKLSRVKVKEIRGEKDWFETKLELLKLVAPMITNQMDRAMIKRQIQETAYYLAAYESGESPQEGGPQDLLLNALVLAILSILNLSKAFHRKEAEEITAALINEHCYWNPRISSLVRKLTPRKVSDLCDKSPFRKIASFRAKKSD